MRHLLFTVALALGVAGAAVAQSPAAEPPAAAAQFDFLVGQWTVEVTPKVSGLAAAIHGTPRLLGTWKAWHAFDGHGVADELRITDASGNPVSLSHALRIYDARSKLWRVQTLDVYRAQFGSATGNWQNGEMLLHGSGTAADGKPMLTRTRYTAIGADAIRLQQDRSSDNGASWDEAALTIVAHRVARAAPR